MRVIDEAYEDLKRQGVEPDMTFIFRGPSARLVSADRTDVPLDKEAVYEEIAEQIKALLAKPNVRMKVCSIDAAAGPRSHRQHFCLTDWLSVQGLRDHHQNGCAARHRRPWRGSFHA